MPLTLGNPDGHGLTTIKAQALSSIKPEGQLHRGLVSIPLLTLNSPSHQPPSRALKTPKMLVVFQDFKAKQHQKHDMKAYAVFHKY